MVKANDDGACLRLAHAQVENEIPARLRRGAREYSPLQLRIFLSFLLFFNSKMRNSECVCVRARARVCVHVG